MNVSKMPWGCYFGTSVLFKLCVCVCVGGGVSVSFMNNFCAKYAVFYCALLNRYNIVNAFKNFLLKCT